MIKIQMRSAADGPQVWIGGVDVTGRMTRLELLPEGQARVRLVERQFVQGRYEVIS